MERTTALACWLSDWRAGASVAAAGAYSSLVREGSWGEGRLDWVLSWRADPWLALCDLPGCWRAL